MAYFPFFIDIEYKKCCIVGGGSVAYRKVKAFIAFDAEITVISPEISDEIRSFENKITMINRNYTESDLQNAFLVIAATNHPEINYKISDYCRQRNILVNVVDDKEKCSFLFPALIRRKDLVVGVTTSGKSPMLAGRLKKSIDSIIPDYYDTLLDTLGSYRQSVKAEIKSEKLRSKVFKELLQSGIEKEGKLEPSDFDKIIKKYKNISDEE